MVQSGEFREPIDIETGATVTTDTGGHTTGYTKVFRNVLAKDSHSLASAVTVAGELVSTVRHTYTIRYRPGVTKGMYVYDAHLPNRLYIQSVADPDGRREVLQLLCADIKG